MLFFETCKFFVQKPPPLRREDDVEGDVLRDGRRKMAEDGRRWPKAEGRRGLKAELLLLLLQLFV